MEKVNYTKSISWGHPVLDKYSKGIPANQMSVIESSDDFVGLSALGCYIEAGLENNEKCALVSLDTPELLHDKLKTVGFDFSGALREERLFIFTYQSEIAHEVGLIHNFKTFFDELVRMCVGAPARLGLFQVDCLVNLNSVMLMNNSTQKLALCAPIFEEHGTTVLGHYIKYNDRVHRELSTAFKKTMAAYYQFTPHGNHLYDFYSFKLPWFRPFDGSVSFKLKEGQGLVYEVPNSSRNTA